MTSRSISPIASFLILILLVVLIKLASMSIQTSIATPTPTVVIPTHTKILDCYLKSTTADAVVYIHVHSSNDEVIQEFCASMLDVKNWSSVPANARMSFLKYSTNMESVSYDTISTIPLVCDFESIRLHITGSIYSVNTKLAQSYCSP